MIGRNDTYYLEEKDIVAINNRFEHETGTFSNATVGRRIAAGGQAIVHYLTVDNSLDKYVIKVFYSKNNDQSLLERSFNKIKDVNDRLIEVGQKKRISVLLDWFSVNVNGNKLFCSVESFLNNLSDYDVTNESRNDKHREIAFRIGFDLLPLLQCCTEQTYPDSKEGFIMHRDIKPENIFLKSADISSGLCLGDFGIVTHSDAQGGPTTLDRKFAGTSETMTHDILMRREGDLEFADLRKSDMYSLGITMYYYLNNCQYPFKKPFSTLEEYPEWKAERKKGCPKTLKNGSPLLQSIVYRAIEYYPKDRFSSCDEMLAELKRTDEYRDFIDPTPIPMPKPTPTIVPIDNSILKQHKTNKWLFVLIAVLLVVIFTMASIMADNNSKGKHTEIYKSTTDISLNNTDMLTEYEALTETSTLNSIIVTQKIRDKLKVDAVFSGDTITIDEEPSETFYGSISETNKTQSFSYTAPRYGRYRFDLTEVKANASLRLLVWDSNGSNIIDTYSNGDYDTLNAGETYSIEVRYYTGNTDFVLVIGVPKESVDISGATVINDQIMYKDQKNIYNFTAPISGTYRFDLTETNANDSFRLMMWDHLDKNIIDTYSGGDYVFLNAGETYQIQVRYYSGFGSYKMVIGYQKETVDISEYASVVDSIQYENQKNKYVFSAPVSGRYRFDLTETNANDSFRLMMWDKHDNLLLDTYSGGGYVDLTSGEKYDVQVRHYTGFGSYKLNIGYQTKSIDISDADLVKDKITFKNQKNVYFYTPSNSTEYTIELSQYKSSNSFRLMVWDEYENNIVDTYSGKKMVKLDANHTYQIQVRHYNGFDDYTLRIS